jgi:putative oxidoreductase
MANSKSATDTTAAFTSPGEDLGKLLLRLVLGVLVLLHGLLKVTGGNDFVVGLMTKLGLPGALGHLVYLGEVLGPLLLIAGIWTRIGALLVTANMLCAILLAGLGRLAKLNQFGGWALELEGMFLFGALAIALMGAGRYSLGGANGRFN